jgi:hypothetical protein
LGLRFNASDLGVGVGAGVVDVRSVHTGNESTVKEGPAQDASGRKRTKSDGHGLGFGSALRKLGLGMLTRGGGGKKSAMEKEVVP